MTPPDQTTFPVREPLDGLSPFTSASRAQSDSDSWLGDVGRQLIHAAIAVAIAIAVWTTIINWFTRHIEQELAKVPPVKFEVKPLEFQEFDVRAFTEPLGFSRKIDRGPPPGTVPSAQSAE